MGRRTLRTVGSSPKGAALWERLGEGGAVIEGSTPVGPVWRSGASGSNGGAGTVAGAALSQPLPRRYRARERS